jgi:exodeoxyribonuclease V alpha subunit
MSVRQDDRTAGKMYETVLRVCFGIAPTGLVQKACAALRDDLLHVRDPLVLAGKARIPGKHATRLLMAIERGGGHKRLSQLVDIMKLGLSATMASKLLADGKRASDVAENPYESLRALGGRLDDAEAIARRVNISEIDRAAGHVTWHLASCSGGGHAAAAAGSLIVKVRFGLGIPHERAKEIVENALVDGGHTVRISETLMTTSDVWRRERFIAAEIARRSKLTFPLDTVQRAPLDTVQRAPLDTVQRAPLDTVQRAALSMALTTGLCVITGGPGTGKTAVSRAILEALAGETVIMTAPTGRAARNLEGRTLAYHRARRECIQDMTSMPNDVICIIVDEASMLTLDLAETVFRMAPKDTCRIVLVGDIHQLPPVGIGNVFADIVNARACPTTVLESNYRSSRGILECARCILERPDDIAANEDVEIIHGEGKDDILRGVLETVARYPDAVVLTATNESRRLLARAIQFQRRGCVDGVRGGVVRGGGVRGGVLSEGQEVTLEYRGPGESVAVRTVPPQGNAHEMTIADALESTDPRGGIRIDNGHATAYIGERVILTKNASSELEACNGDVGVLATSNAIDLMGGKRVTVVPTNLALADALTVHKCQGSEFDTVVIAVFYSSFWDAPLLYTASTRAKKKLVIVGSLGDIRRVASTSRASRMGGLHNLLL